MNEQANYTGNAHWSDLVMTRYGRPIVTDHMSVMSCVTCL